MLTLNDGRKEMYQWDIGRIATVDVECDVVHFSNLKYGGSLSVEVKNGEVAIPNKLLTSGEPIYCWAFVADENGNYTKQEQTLNVNKRAKPSDYVYTETETLTWKSLDERITELEKGGTGGSGVNGKDGATFIPTVSPEGIISWENDQGLQNPTPVNINGKSAYTYAVEGGYVGTEEEFAAKMAQERFANPNSLIFTGAVTGNYDGSSPLTVDIPLGGGSDVSVDNTLTISGAAADAKATGDQIRAINEEIADLQKGGLLTVKTITVDDDGETETIPVTGIMLDYTSIEINVGESMQLAANITPPNATNTAVTWESSSDSIATVVNGYVTAVSAGSAVITAKSVENPSITETCTVVVAEETGGGGDTPTGGKVQLSTHNIVDGSCINKRGKVVAINDTAHYVEIPYSDGMFVSTGLNLGWLGSYPPFLVLDNGTYTKPEYATGDIFNIGNTAPCQYSATLTGFSDGSSVFVNMHYPAGADIAAYDAYYYIPGGAE